MAELRRSVAAEGLPDEGMRGLAATDAARLALAADAEALRATFAAALVGPSAAQAYHAARALRCVVGSAATVAAVCAQVAAPLCAALGRRQEPAVVAWLLLAAMRMAQHPEARGSLLRAGAVRALAPHASRREDGGDDDDGTPAPRPDLMAAIALSLLAGSGAAAEPASHVPLRAVGPVVQVLMRRLTTSSAAEAVQARAFCGMPVDYRPRIVAQALAQLLEASSAHAAVAWQTLLPETLSTAAPTWWRWRAAAAPRCWRPPAPARPARTDHDRAEQLRSAPAAPPGTWERRANESEEAARCELCISVVKAALGQTLPAGQQGTEMQIRKEKIRDGAEAGSEGDGDGEDDGAAAFGPNRLEARGSQPADKFWSQAEDRDAAGSRTRSRTIEAFASPGAEGCDMPLQEG
ncbi:unnamed protein product [Prorocentrum cordatum]|uniref:RING-type E3 ubiquitin transferase n=1 Tax=Prorocentrum cordatum TaxID=2364126 RepID=A0ABN9UNE2_9DINO|nr:unnamed protein product [Polarella glacialis]